MFYGGKDDHIPTDYIRAVDGQLEAFGVDVETILYEEAGHGFCNSRLRPSMPARHRMRGGWR